jgi:ribosomal protein L25 (general stress protein Ctc)
MATSNHRELVIGQLDAFIAELEDHKSRITRMRNDGFIPAEIYEAEMRAASLDISHMKTTRDILASHR